MKTTLNNQTISDIAVTFNGVPTIFRAEGTNTPSACEQYQFNPNYFTANDNSYMNFNGTTFSFTNDYSEAVGNKIYISPNSSANLRRLSAMSMARAFNNSSLGGSYNAYVKDNTCILEAKTPYVHGDDPSFSESNINYTHSRTSTSYEFYDSILDLDIMSDGEFVSQMSKKCATNDVMFDLSPILNASTKDGEAFKYTITLSQGTNSDYSQKYTSGDIYAINGYSCNQGNMFITDSELYEDAYILQNVSRGGTKVQYNKTILYVYDPSITLSFFSKSPQSVGVQITYLDSFFNTLGTSSTSASLSEGITDSSFSLSSLFNSASYVDITVLGKTIRYNVVKPLKYTDMNQRVYFRNSYGGLSFFDFSGGRTEQRSSDKTTYMKNNFDIYREGVRSLNKIYSNELEYEVTLTTHLMDYDGIYTLYDLLASHYAYTSINGVTYEIIVNDLNVEETQTNNVYQAEITYVYSSNDTF